jgi:2'-5' RNA ligase
MDAKRDFLTNRYQHIWDGAFDQVRHGQITIDPLLAQRKADQRRCLTVLVRPSGSVQAAIATLFAELRGIEPEQYYYAAEELHVTVLSLFTATLDHARLLARYEEYLAAVQAALAQGQTFEIEFTGITLSREAILIQGFPDSLALQELREALRQELRARGLVEGLDGRYLLQTAHITAVRFREPLRQPLIFGQILEKYRNYKFGQTAVKELQLVRNDWYMSQRSVEVLQRYSLAESAES